MTATRKPRTKKATGHVSHEQTLAAKVSATESAVYAARKALEAAERASETAREVFARTVYRNWAAGHTDHAGWLRSYCLTGDLWDVVGRAAFLQADGLDNPESVSAWAEVFRAVAKHKGW